VCVYIYIESAAYIYRYIDKDIPYIDVSIYIYASVLNGKRKPRLFSFHPFTVCSLCKQKFVVYPFVYEETNGSYPFSKRLNGLNRLNRLALL
jgi:hypothetical protein